MVSMSQLLIYLSFLSLNLKEFNAKSVKQYKFLIINFWIWYCMLISLVMLKSDLGSNLNCCMLLSLHCGCFSFMRAKEYFIMVFSFQAKRAIAHRTIFLELCDGICGVDCLCLIYFNTLEMYDYGVVLITSNMQHGSWPLNAFLSFRSFKERLKRLQWLPRGLKNCLKLVNLLLVKTQVYIMFQSCSSGHLLPLNDIGCLYVHTMSLLLI